MNSSIVFREATVEDADAIADQIVASRDKVRDYDGGPEGTADRFRVTSLAPITRGSPSLRARSGWRCSTAARWTRRLPPHDKAGLRG